MKRVLVILSCAVFGVAACASIVEEQRQTVMVDTPACHQARCRLTNSEGAYFVPSSPDLVVVNRAFGKLTVVCEKDGLSATSVHTSSFNEGLVGNILLGGIPGALIDSGSGAGYTYDSILVNPLRCDATPSQ